MVGSALRRLFIAFGGLVVRLRLTHVFGHGRGLVSRLLGLRSVFLSSAHGNGLKGLHLRFIRLRKHLVQVSLVEHGVVHIVGLDHVDELVAQQGVHGIFDAVTLGHLKRHDATRNVICRHLLRGNLVRLGEQRFEVCRRYAVR